MKQRLAEMAQLVADNTFKNQRRQKEKYDKGTKQCSFEVRDQVLVLLPSGANKLKLQWTGPYKIISKVGTVNYEIETPGRRREKKIYHVNLLNKWHVLSSAQVSLVAQGSGEDDESVEVDWAGVDT